MRTLTMTLMACLIALALSACSSESAKAPANVAVPTEVASDPLVMTAEAVGPARLGMTEPELASALGSSLSLSSDMVTFEEGFDVRPVTVDGNEVFFVQFDDSGRIGTIVTTSELVRTTEGLAPGMTIDDAVALLGAPAFTFYRFEGGRESVEFATGVPQLVRPRGADGVSPAGTYDFDVEVEVPMGPFTATDHSPGSVILSLTIEG